MDDINQPAVVASPLDLIHALRKGDEGARERAYRAVFGSTVGRFVLADILRGSGLGEHAGFMDPEHLTYRNGQQDLAIEISKMAGFDQAARVAMHLTDTLEGQDNDRTDPDPDAYTGPDAEPIT